MVALFGNKGQFATPSEIDLDLRVGDVRGDVAYRRIADVADCGLGRLSWAESALAGVASGRTGVRAKAAAPLRARNRLSRPFATIDAAGSASITRMTASGVACRRCLMAYGARTSIQARSSTNPLASRRSSVLEPSPKEP